MPTKANPGEFALPTYKKWGREDSERDQLIEHMTSAHGLSTDGLTDREIVDTHARAHPGHDWSRHTVERYAYEGDRRVLRSGPEFEHDLALSGHARDVASHDARVAEYQRARNADAYVAAHLTPDTIRDVALEVIDQGINSMLLGAVDASKLVRLLADRFDSVTKDLADGPFRINERDLSRTKVVKTLEDLVTSGVLIKFKGSNIVLGLVRNAHRSTWYYTTTERVGRADAERQSATEALQARRERFQKAWAALPLDRLNDEVNANNQITEVTIPLELFERLVGAQAGVS